MDNETIRQYARAGALDMCRKAVTEFPDILPELNALAAPSPAVNLKPYSRRKMKAVMNILEPKPRKTRGWSPAARKAAAVRMKAYWAKQRRKK